MKHQLDVEETQYVQADWFPVTISTDNPEITYLRDDFRIVITDNYFYAVLDGPNGPQLEIKEPLVAYTGTRREGYTVETEDTTYYLTKTKHCACGSRLKGFILFPGVPHASQMPKPKE